jgi:nucleoside-diphosphate kinase
MHEQTFVIIKPDAYSRYLVGKIIKRLEGIGLNIQHIEMRRKNASWCKKHYAHVYQAALVDFDHTAQLIYTNLENSMIKRTIGIILSGPNAVARVRRMIGVINPLEAEPGTIRGDFGNAASPYNLIHASDSIEEAQKEIELYFDSETDV